ncbi:ribonuclease P protein subunit p25-like protein [Temnothorax curvispinosus]|uniref:Ribonuclease P protein subunit p25-like protein n=1 Tax=Temnothorax curvispinosus TaxID=300111 RepID=A0A6J1RK89_9HYME|nr:ribonuclease P protein subunit p25-like protein [Temnothorax curvispinosus]
MGRSKLKKKLQQKKPIAKETEESTSTKVPIDNLPEKFLWMHVKSGTKIRNVLAYALKEFPSCNSIVWTGIGHGIMKVISCAEIFKRKHEGLHQVTKLRYVSSEKSKEDTATETHRIPEIHILLTKDIKDTTQLGYQAPGDCGKFLKKEDATGSKTNSTTEKTDNVPCIDKQSSTMEKSGKRKNINKLKKKAEPPLKKNKVS